MAITRSTGAFIGTDESTLTSILNNGTATGGEVDVLGDNTSVGDIWLYALVQSTVTAGSFDITVNNRRVSGQAYARTGVSRSITPINGTQKIPLGKTTASRYVQVTVLNNATGATGSVAILYELEKLS